ncbi:MAG: lysophospholipid acyltransferase family protein [Salinisphaera sp.]|nr:lysophospholipid acyltransferase family protein [Salinisphaera sp.]
MARYHLIPRRYQQALADVEPLIWRVEAIVFALLTGLLRALPERLAKAVAGQLFVAFGLRGRRARRVRGNLAVAFAGSSPARQTALLKASVQNAGVALVELAQARRIWRARERRLEFVLAPGASAPQAGRPTVFVTAHVGAWQLTTLLGPQFGVIMPIIYAPERNPYLDQKLRHLRSAFRCPLVASRGGVRELVQALNRGHCIGLTLDTRLDAGEALPFFGEPAMTNTVAARLALRYRCDLVPVLAERLPGGKYRVNLLPPIRPGENQADTGARARAMTTQINRLFESWISERPGQWLCMKRRWPKATEQRYLQRIGGN